VEYIFREHDNPSSLGLVGEDMTGPSDTKAPLKTVIKLRLKAKHLNRKSWLNTSDFELLKRHRIFGFIGEEANGFNLRDGNIC
jgi:hypothetical protein